MARVKTITPVIALLVTMLIGDYFGIEGLTVACAAAQ